MKEAICFTEALACSYKENLQTMRSATYQKIFGQNQTAYIFLRTLPGTLPVNKIYGASMHQVNIDYPVFAGGAFLLLKRKRIKGTRMDGML